MIELRFPAPAPAESVNVTLRRHWSTRHRDATGASSPWRQAAWAAMLAAYPGRGPRDRTLPPCRVEMEIPVRNWRTADPHNFVGSVLKAVVDGLVDAAAWPDDTAAWVSVAEPVLVPLGRPVLIRLLPRDGTIRTAPAMLGRRPSSRGGP